MDVPFDSPPSRTRRLLDESVSVLGGAFFTLGLFMAISHFGNGNPAIQAEPEEIHLVTSLTEPPPPDPKVQPNSEDVTIPLTGIEIHAVADSAVKVSVVPPDLDKIIPPADLPPKATIQFDQVMSDLRPKAGMGNLAHIYQQNEVDEAPSAVVKTIARVQGRIHEDFSALKVVLLLVIDIDGAVSNIRVLKPSGS